MNRAHSGTTASLCFCPKPIDIIDKPGSRHRHLAIRIRQRVLCLIVNISVVKFVLPC